MTLQIEMLAARPLFALRLVGPLEHTLPEGFTRLMAWAERHHLSGEWMAIYYDNPQQVAPEALRVDVALAAAPDVPLPADADDAGVRRLTLAAGQYALAAVQVTQHDFATPWMALFAEQLPASGYRPSGGGCFERYLNDGRLTGEWQLELGVPVVKG